MASTKPTIPAKLVNDIQAMTCQKLHNNSPSRFGLIVSIDVTFNCKIQGAIEHMLEEWVWDSLDRAHRALDFDVCWNFAVTDSWSAYFFNI